MPSANVVWATSTIARVLAIIPGLWFAGRLLPRLADALPAGAADVVRSRRSVRFAFWLILGSLFTAPLIDLISFLFSLTEIFTLANWSGQPHFSAEFGSVPLAWYVILNDLVTLTAYSSVMWASRRLCEELRAREKQPFEMSAIEMALVLMTGGAVVNRAVALMLPFRLNFRHYLKLRH